MELPVKKESVSSVQNGMGAEEMEAGRTGRLFDHVEDHEFVHQDGGSNNEEK